MSKLMRNLLFGVVAVLVIGALAVWLAPMIQKNRAAATKTPVPKSVYVIDYGADYVRRYQFATQYFRSYDRLKTVREAIFTFRPDTDFEITLEYLTDYEVRRDITDEYTHEHIECRSWRLVPRNLRWRDLSVFPFAYVARRRPGCRHVRHFSMRLTCTGAGYDMPILSAQVFYTYEGRDR